MVGSHERLAPTRLRGEVTVGDFLKHRHGRTWSPSARPIALPGHPEGRDGTTDKPDILR
jgi:hypothetical protein